MYALYWKKSVINTPQKTVEAPFGVLMFKVEKCKWIPTLMRSRHHCCPIIRGEEHQCVVVDSQTDQVSQKLTDAVIQFHHRIAITTRQITQCLPTLITAIKALKITPDSLFSCSNPDSITNSVKLAHVWNLSCDRWMWYMEEDRCLRYMCAGYKTLRCGVSGWIPPLPAPG